MGSERESGTTVVNQTTTPTPTAEEVEMNKLALERERANQQGMIDVQGSGLSLVNNLLQGNANLPGFFNTLAGGINESQTQNISQQALRDLYPQFQGQGILDSGTAASVAGRTAGDIRTNVAEYNQQNLLNLLNLALSGQAQIQQPILNQSSILSSRLQGLRSVNTQGTTNTSQTSTSSWGNQLMGGLTGMGRVASGIGSLPWGGGGWL